MLSARALLQVFHQFIRPEMFWEWLEFLYSQESQTLKFFQDYPLTVSRHCLPFLFQSQLNESRGLV